MSTYKLFLPKYTFALYTITLMYHLDLYLLLLIIALFFKN